MMHCGTTRYRIHIRDTRNERNISYAFYRYESRLFFSASYATAAAAVKLESVSLYVCSRNGIAKRNRDGKTQRTRYRTWDNRKKGEFADRKEKVSVYETRERSMSFRSYVRDARARVCVCVCVCMREKERESYMLHIYTRYTFYMLRVVHISAYKIARDIAMSDYVFTTRRAVGTGSQNSRCSRFRVHLSLTITSTIL